MKVLIRGLTGNHFKGLNEERCKSIKLGFFFCHYVCEEKVPLSLEKNSKKHTTLFSIHQNAKLFNHLNTKYFL